MHANLDHGHLPTKHEDNTHLQNDPESVPNVDCIELLEALCAIASLEEERLPHCRVSETLLQMAGLAGEDDGREGLYGLEDGFELLLIWVLRELEGLHGSPAVDGPFGRSRQRRRLGGLVGDDGGLGGLGGVDG